MTRAEPEGVISWLLHEGLQGRPEPELLSKFCERLNGCGFRLEQAVVFLDTLHPVLESQGHYWHASDNNSAELRNFVRPEAQDNARQWRGSPFFYMLEKGLNELHLPLSISDLGEFAILDDLRKAGHSDYFAMIHPLGAKDVVGEMDGLYSRWSTKRPEGFRERELANLRSLVPALALCMKSAALRRVTGALVDVYLGKDAGRRVLSGKIERGKVDSIDTVLWFSDMRDYTSISENMGSEQLIKMLDDYAEAVITSVHENGGDVLKLIGDGVLAIFNQTDPKEAAAAGLRAWREFDRRLHDLNRKRDHLAEITTSVHVGLHVGRVFYGNIGSDDRLDFTVIGPAVNEAARIVAACRSLDRGLVISEGLYRLLLPGDILDFVDLGLQRLKGVHHDMRLYGLG